MRLDAWIIGRGLTSAAFGELAGIGGKQLVHKYRRAERFPSPENLRRIRAATGGAVTSEDFVDHYAEVSDRQGAAPDSDGVGEKVSENQNTLAGRRVA